jgi:hypothetical protein
MEACDLTVESLAPLGESRYNEAMRKAEAAGLDDETLFDRLTLVGIDNGFTRTTSLGTCFEIR